MTSPDLVFDERVVEAILDHARRGAPEEVCGVLGGTETRVTEAVSVSNVASTPETRYELDPGETLDAIDRVETSATHVGFYHSHPQGPPAPSATDEAAATWTGYVYAIASLPDSQIRAWRWTGDRFERLAVTVSPSRE